MDTIGIVFRIRGFATEYLVREQPELWRDKEDLGPWNPVPYPSLDKAWEKAHALSTPEQRVLAVGRTTGQRAEMRQTPPQDKRHHHPHQHRPHDPDWRTRVPNAGIE